MFDMENMTDDDKKMFTGMLGSLLGGGGGTGGSGFMPQLMKMMMSEYGKEDEEEEDNPLAYPPPIPEFAEGGEVFAPEPEMSMGEDFALPLMERASDVLSDEDYGLLSAAVDMHPELPRIFDDILMSVEEFEGGGSVDGPGTGTSDSIPAKLSDGEFVFTAKAVQQLGVDKLYKMMKKAEEDFDSATMDQSADQEFAMGGFVQRKCK